MTVPEFMPVLSAGSHDDPSKGACVMEYVSMLAGEPFSDTPSCTHPVLARAAQNVNDRLPDSERHLLVPLIGRLFGTSQGAGDRVLNVRLAVWSARRVLPLVRSESREVCDAAIRAAERWGEDPSDQNASAASAAANAATAAANAANAYAAASAAYAAYAAASAAANAASAAANAANAASAAASAANASASAYAAYAAADSAAAYAAYAAASAAANAADSAANSAANVEFLSDLIDEYDRLTGRTHHAEVTADQLADLACAVGT